MGKIPVPARSGDDLESDMDRSPLNQTKNLHFAAPTKQNFAGGVQRAAKHFVTPPKRENTVASPPAEGPLLEQAPNTLAPATNGRSPPFVSRAALWISGSFGLEVPTERALRKVVEGLRAAI